MVDDGCGGNWAGNVFIACFGTALGTVRAAWAAGADAAFATVAPAAAGDAAATGLAAGIGAAWATGFLAWATGLVLAWDLTAAAGFAADAAFGCAADFAAGLTAAFTGLADFEVAVFAALALLMDLVFVLDTLVLADALPRAGGGATFAAGLTVRVDFLLSWVLLSFLAGSAADAALD
jgi:hypothetical protein